MHNGYLYFIYALVDPRTKAVRYVGASERPAIRLYQHINAATSKTFRRRSTTSEWIRELADAGLRPELIILEQFQTWSNGFKVETEAEWIWHFRDSGCDLLNRYPFIRRDRHSGRSEILKTRANIRQ